MKKFLFIAILFFFFPKAALANDDFEVNASVVYSLGNAGEADVTHKISIRNKKSEVYASDYTFNLGGFEPTSLAVLDAKGKPLKYEKNEAENGESYKIIFEKATVGRDQVTTFEIRYKNKSLATQTGEVWEISIPKLAEEDKFDSYDVELKIPTSFGQLAYVSPEPKTQNYLGNEINYEFSKEQLVQSGVIIAFGKFQVYSFDIVYHLENPVNQKAPLEIAIPPDTAFQKMIYSSIDPLPQDISIDQDGNWLATYELAPHARLDVKAQGYIQTYAQRRDFPKSTKEILKLNTRATEFWPSNESRVTSLAKIYNTPQKIYDFVSENLSYDYSRVKANAARLGALGALNSPESAICMEFTDTFIALARANNIPAREINGYAYTENEKLQPLSLVADVLHAWPEYWNSKEQVWVPIDPTWASTTGGIDYFNNFDMKHITFVIHGEDDTKPFAPGSYKLGPNPQKDVYVSLARLPEIRNSKPEISVETKGSIPLLGSSTVISFYNPGPSALYNQEIKIFYDDRVAYREDVTAMPPFSHKEVKLNMPLGLFAQKIPSHVLVSFGNYKTKAPTHKSTAIIVNLAILLLLIFIFVIIILIKTEKIKL
jgi:hypothetical protein